ncbi:MAG: D-glycero-alpha-D-manno-heptose-1,7-bisphosphate 7-phosphatase [Elusimicrobiota bacterium]
MRPAVFLDRDGVLNEAFVENAVSYPPKSAKEFKLLPGVGEACRTLREAGFTLLVVTNQPDVARKKLTLGSAEEINNLVRQKLPVQDVFACYHDDADACDCRKPKPGLLRSAAGRWNVDLSESFMVGDRWSDVEAGRAAGCATILIERGYSRRERCAPDWTASDLKAAATIILERRKNDRKI